MTTTEGPLWTVQLWLWAVCQPTYPVIFLIAGISLWGSSVASHRYDTYFKKRGNELIKKLNKEIRTKKGRDMASTLSFELVSDSNSSNSSTQATFIRRPFCPELTPSFMKRVPKAERIRKKLGKVSCGIYDVEYLDQNSIFSDISGNCSAAGANSVSIQVTAKPDEIPIVVEVIRAEFQYKSYNETTNSTVCQDGFNMWTSATTNSNIDAEKDSVIEVLPGYDLTEASVGSPAEICYRCATLSQSVFLINGSKLAGFSGEYGHMWSYGDTMKITGDNFLGVDINSPWLAVIQTERDLKTFGTRILNERYGKAESLGITFFSTGLVALGVGGVSEVTNRWKSQAKTSQSASSSQNASTSAKSNGSSGNKQQNSGNGSTDTAKTENKPTSSQAASK